MAKTLGYYGADRDFRCFQCGPSGLSEPVEEALSDDGLDYAREECDECGRWVDESGEEAE